MEQKLVEAVDETEKTKKNLALIEAALYVAGRPLDLKTLGSIIKTRSERKVKELAQTLMQEYNSRNTALEILELEDERFVMQLKTEYTAPVRKLAIRPLLSTGPLKTLSYIAYRQPVPQTQVIEVRGHHVYSHLKQLEDLGLIERKNVGRTKIIRTTQFFADYFGLSQDPKTMKRQLKNFFESFGNTEAPTKEER
jgi:segregation and condensation protein B